MAANKLISQLYDRCEISSLLMLKRLAQGVRQGKRISSESPKVIFVGGVQRSGTNMVMDVLERSFVTDVYHERDPRAFDNYRMRDLHEIQNLYKKCRGDHFVIKSLCELQDLNNLMDSFKSSKLIWCFRNYTDVVNSMCVSFNNQAKQVQRIAVDPRSEAWLGLGMSEKTLALVRELVHPSINDSSACALQWYFRNILFFEQNFDKKTNVQLVCYEDLVNSPEQTFSSVFEFLDIPFSPNLSKKVFSSSIRKSSPPKLDSRVAEVCEELYSQLSNLYRGGNIFKDSGLD